MKILAQVLCSMVVGFSFGVGVAIPAPDVQGGVLRGAEVRQNVQGEPITHPGRKKRHSRARFHKKPSFAAQGRSGLVLDRTRIAVRV